MSLFLAASAPVEVQAVADEAQGEQVEVHPPPRHGAAVPPVHRRAATAAAAAAAANASTNTSTTTAAANAATATATAAITQRHPNHPRHPFKPPSVRPELHDYQHREPRRPDGDGPDAGHTRGGAAHAEVYERERGDPHRPEAVQVEHERRAVDCMERHRRPGPYARPLFSST